MGMITPEQDGQETQSAKTAEELQSVVTSLEEIRTSDKFSDALKNAIEELSQFLDNFETQPPKVIVQIAKLSRHVVSSAESAAKRTPFPKNKAELYKAALTVALEPFYKNPAFIQKLKDAIQSGTLTSDEPDLIYEMWRDVAKITHSSATLFRGDQAEKLINFSGWVWEELLKALPEGHELLPFMRIEYQVFLADIGMPVKPKEIITNIEALQKTDLVSNPHRLGTMAIKVQRLGRKIRDRSVTEAGEGVFLVVKAQKPDIAKLLEDPSHAFKALMLKSAQGLIPQNIPSDRKDELHKRLIGLNIVPFLPVTETGIQ